jgi:hypothetical protein
VSTVTNALGFIVQVPIGGASFTGTAGGADCTSSLGPFRVNLASELCFQTELSDTGSITGCGQSNHFALELTGIGVCKYRTSVFSGTFGTNADATFNVSKQPYSKEEGGNFCPREGRLDMDLDLTTTDGTTLLIS